MKDVFEGVGVLAGGGATTAPILSLRSFALILLLDLCGGARAGSGLRPDVTRRAPCNRRLGRGGRDWTTWAGRFLRQSCLRGSREEGEEGGGEGGESSSFPLAHVPPATIAPIFLLRFPQPFPRHPLYITLWARREEKHAEREIRRGACPAPLSLPSALSPPRALKSDDRVQALLTHGYWTHPQASHGTRVVREAEQRRHGITFRARKRRGKRERAMLSAFETALRAPGASARQSWTLDRDTCGASGNRARARGLTLPRRGEAPLRRRPSPPFPPPHLPRHASASSTRTHPPCAAAAERSGLAGARARDGADPAQPPEDRVLPAAARTRGACTPGLSVSLQRRCVAGVGAAPRARPPTPHPLSPTLPPPQTNKNTPQLSLSD